MPGAWHGDRTSTQGLGSPFASKSDPEEARGAPQAALWPRSGEAHEDRRAWPKPEEATGVCASGRSSHSSAILPRPPASPRHLARPPRAATCRVSPPPCGGEELRARSERILARRRVPAPARAALRLTRASSGESLAAAARLLGAVAEASGVAGARGGGRGGGAAEGPAHHQPQGTPPSPGFHRLAPGPWRSAAPGKRPGTSLAMALRHCYWHAHPGARRATDQTQMRRSRQDAPQIQPQVEEGRH